MRATQTPGGHGLGWRGPSLPDIRNYQYQPRILGGALPVRTNNRLKFPTPRDQSYLGSCTAFAATTMARRVYEIDGWHHAFDGSPLFQYYWERYDQGTVDQDSGSTITESLRTLATYGMTAEHNYPYTPAIFAQEPPAFAVQNAIKHRAHAYYQMSQTTQAMMQCLAEGYPFIIGISVYASFEQVASGDIPMPNPAEAFLGGHAICIADYDSTTFRFTFQNSWGVGWGDHGYGTIPFAYLASASLAADVWTLRLTS